MRRALLLAVVSACSGSTAVPDAAPRQLQLNVVIADGTVTLHTNQSDVGPTGCSGVDMFPEPGTALQIGDGISCEQSCLTRIALEIGGTTVDPYFHPGVPTTIAADVEAAGGAQLFIFGCGGIATIALPVVSVPQPTLTATRDATNRTITSTWSAVPPAASALLVFGAGVWADEVHVTESPYTFTEESDVSTMAYGGVSVTTFAPPTIAASDFGPIHIWTGASMYVSLY